MKATKKPSKPSKPSTRGKESSKGVPRGRPSKATKAAKQAKPSIKSLARSKAAAAAKIAATKKAAKMVFEIGGNYTKILKALSNISMPKSIAMICESTGIERGACAYAMRRLDSAGFLKKSGVSRTTNYSLTKKAINAIAMNGTPAKSKPAEKPAEKPAAELSKADLPIGTAAVPPSTQPVAQA
jgi:hypothetical protein